MFANMIPKHPRSCLALGISLLLVFRNITVCEAGIFGNDAKCTAAEASLKTLGLSDDAITSLKPNSGRFKMYKYKRALRVRLARRIHEILTACKVIVDKLPKKGSCDKAYKTFIGKYDQQARDHLEHFKDGTHPFCPSICELKRKYIQIKFDLPGEEKDLVPSQENVDKLEHDLADKLKKILEFREDFDVNYFGTKKFIDIYFTQACELLENSKDRVKEAEERLLRFVDKRDPGRSLATYARSTGADFQKRRKDAVENGLEDRILNLRYVKALNDHFLVDLRSEISGEEKEAKKKNCIRVGALIPSGTDSMDLVTQLDIITKYYQAKSPTYEPLQEEEDEKYKEEFEKLDKNRFLTKKKKKGTRFGQSKVRFFDHNKIPSTVETERVEDLEVIDRKNAEPDYKKTGDTRKANGQKIVYSQETHKSKSEGKFGTDQQLKQMKAREAAFKNAGNKSILKKHQKRDAKTNSIYYTKVPRGYCVQSMVTFGRSEN